MTATPTAFYDLTVSIVSYNSKDLVRQCLHSIKEKTQEISYQIIVVDNESKDGTPDMVAADFPEVILIRSGKNMGFSSATNLALKQASSRYFVLFGADASLRNDAFSMLVRFMDEHPDCGIACPQLYYPDGKVQISYYPFRYPKKRAMREVAPRIREIKTVLGLRKVENKKKKKEVAPDQPIEVQRPRGVCFMIRMECVQEIGPMDGNLFIFAEDVDWAWRARQAGWKRYMAPSASVYHEDHASVSKKASLMEKIQMQSVYYFFYKHFGFKAWLGIRLGNFTGALLALLLSFITLLGSKRSRLSSKGHYMEFKALCKLASLTKKYFRQMQYDKTTSLNKPIDSEVSMTGIDFIENIAQKAMQHPNVYIKPGHNGPYFHPETVLRNKGHWLITFCKLYEWTGNEVYKQKASELAEHLLSSEARPFGYSFYHRNASGKDRCNGLIGQAWTFEALAQAYETFQEDTFSKLAEEVFLQHHFNEKYALWNILEINGRNLPIDNAFNHQLWFAATISLIKTDNTLIQERIICFLDKLLDNVTIMENGLIYHEFEFEPTDRYARIHKVGVKSRLMEFLSLSAKKNTPKLTPIEKKEKLWKIMKHKSIGYHAFNTYAFALLKQSYPKHPLWDSAIIQKVVNYLFTDEYRQGIRQNKYSFAYNPPGFEVPFSVQTLLSSTELSPTFAQDWINKQIDTTYNEKTYMFDISNQDPLTLTARLYEATRIEKGTLSSIIVEKV